MIINLKKINLETIFILIIFSTLIWAGCAVLWDYKISHEFPYGYLASDTFQHQVRTESIKEMGNYKSEASYIVAGYKDVIGFYPPLIYHIGVLFSNTAGLETYDGSYFLIFFFAAMAALIMYLIIRDFNKKIAILSIPLSLLIFSKALYAGFTWGHWPSIVAQVFLIALFWIILKIKIKRSYILLGIILSGIIMAHTSEAFFGVIFMGLYFGYGLIIKRLNWTNVKSAGIGCAIAGILCLYYLIIFKNTWGKLQSYRFSISPTFSGTLSFYMKDFGAILLIIMAIGIIMMLLLYKKLSVAAIIGFVMLLIGYGNYYGFENRAFQARFFWPIYLSIFFGFGIYQLMKFLTKKSYYYFAAAILLLVIFNTSMIPAIPSTSRFTSQGMMDSHHWQILMWLKDNTPKDAKLYFFYGDIYYQDALLRNAKREHYLVDRTDFINTLQNNTIKRNYHTRAASDSGAGFPYRDSFFSYGMHADEGWIRTIERDICNYDYYIFDMASSQQVLAQYNMIIMQKLLEKEYFNEIYRNQINIVLKNNRQGEDCIETQTFN